MANGYSMNIMGVDLNNPIVMPQGVMDIIRVNENTPNLQLIQSFPVISRNGNVHIHRDPTNGQLYEMTDEFHSMIPQILNNQTNQVAINGGTTLNEIVQVPEIVDKFTNTTALQTFSNLLAGSVDLNQIQLSTNSNRVNRPLQVSDRIGSLSYLMDTGQSLPSMNNTDGNQNILQNNEVLQPNIPMGIVTSNTPRHAYPTIMVVSNVTFNTSTYANFVNRHAYPTV